MSKLIQWKNTVFGDVNKQKKRAWARLNGIQKQLVISASLNLLKLDKKIKLDLEAILNQEKLLWFQKSGVIGLVLEIIIRNFTIWQLRL